MVIVVAASWSSKSRDQAPDRPWDDAPLILSLCVLLYLVQHSPEIQAVSVQDVVD